MLRRAFALLGLAVAVLAACATAKKNQPMATLRHPAAPERADTLVVLLPGAGDSATTYDREGFIAAAREAGSAVDLVAVDAHAGYYFGRTLTDRLWEDVLAPARAEAPASSPRRRRPARRAPASAPRAGPAAPRPAAARPPARR